MSKGALMHILTQFEHRLLLTVSKTQHCWIMSVQKSGVEDISNAAVIS